MNRNLRTVFLINVILLNSNNISCSSPFAQTSGLTQIIRGKVIDHDSKFAIPGVNVLIRNTSPALGASTDADGNFQINNVPTGRHDIEFVYIGYEPLAPAKKLSLMPNSKRR
jgi:hypothetical protein